MRAYQFYRGFKPLTRDVTNEHLLCEGEELDEGDIRAMLIGQSAINMKSHWALNSARNGCEKSMMNLQWLTPINWILRILLMINIFFSPPSWCQRMGNIDSDCRVMYDGVSVIRSPMPVFRTMLFTYGVPLCLFG